MSALKLAQLAALAVGALLPLEAAARFGHFAPGAAARCWRWGLASTGAIDSFLL